MDFFMEEFELTFETEEGDGLHFLFDMDFHLFVESISSVVVVKKYSCTYDSVISKMIAVFTFECKEVSGYVPNTILGSIYTYK